MNLDFWYCKWKKNKIIVELSHWVIWFFFKEYNIFKLHTLLPQYVRKIISIFDSLETCITPYALPVFPSSLRMWWSSRIDEIKSSLVSISALVFSSLKKEWNFEEDWLVVDYMMETLIISTQEIFKLYEMNGF